MAALFALWLVMAIVSIPWAMVVARNRGYPMAPWFLLALIFGVFAVAAAYLLPRKARDERFADAASRSLTTQTVSAGRTMRDTARKEAPGATKGLGRSAANTAMNMGLGAREAVAQRRAARASELGDQPQLSAARRFGATFARATDDFKAGVRDTRGTEDATPEVESGEPVTGARGFGRRISQAARDIRTGVEEERNRRAGEPESDPPAESDLTRADDDPASPSSSD